MTAVVDELKIEGGLARVITAVLVGTAGAFGYAAGWLRPNHAPPSLVFSRGGDQAKQRGGDSCVAQIGPEEPYAPASGEG
jgi:hypothetical protein